MLPPLAVKTVSLLFMVFYDVIVVTYKLQEQYSQPSSPHFSFSRLTYFIWFMCRYHSLSPIVSNWNNVSTFFIAVILIVIFAWCTNKNVISSTENCDWGKRGEIITMKLKKLVVMQVAHWLLVSLQWKNQKGTKKQLDFL